jgi:hypothetical protein
MTPSRDSATFGSAPRAFCLAILACVAGVAHAAGGSLQVRGDRLFIAASVNGHETEALLDSAAEATLIDAAWAKSLGLKGSGNAVARGSGGNTEAELATHVTLSAAGCDLEDRKIAIVDLSDVSKRLIGRPVRLILGRELFDAARLSININAGTIGVTDRGAIPPGVPLALAEHAGIESFPVEVEGIANVAADFDLGNGSDILIGERFAREHGLLTPERIIAREKGGGLGGAIEREVILLKRLAVAGHEFHDVRAVVDPMGNAGDLNLGVKILREFVMVVDFGRHSIWLAPAKSNVLTPSMEN